MQLRRNFLMIHPPVTTKLKDQPPLRTELGERIPQQLVILRNQRPLLYIIVLRPRQLLQLPQQPRVVSRLSKVIQGPVSRDREDIPVQVLNHIQQVPTQPKFDKNFLGDLLRSIWRMGNGQHVSKNTIFIAVKKTIKRTGSKLGSLL